MQTLAVRRSSRPCSASMLVADYPTQVDLSRARLCSRPTAFARARSPDDADSAVSTCDERTHCRCSHQKPQRR
ncbi:hypothetical protein EUGRSUZ_C00008 [Eucalyptus grandis]|uniref:Uncharacterized protein n=2 Tax=Eucalyptus grandis TaxID=71139 RepID=A0ACC3L9G7_EUCGR|nr:hypothetical protein EUGRSUZ_C00008 [Eucalyptus grandis]